MNLFQKKQAEEPQDISEVLARFKELQDQCAALAKEVKNLKEQNKRHIDKVAVVRFNPFDGLGSNQSFSLAMLDSNNRGAVITSLFSRDSNRVYAKPIENGASTYPLSREEKEAIELAQSARNSKSQEPNPK
jgi:hypothetical protein